MRVDLLQMVPGAAPWLAWTFLGNSVAEYLAAFLVILVLGGGLKLYAIVLRKRLRVLTARSTTIWDDLLLDVIDRAVNPILLAGGLWLLTRSLHVPARVAALADVVLTLAVTWCGLSAVLRVVDVFSRNYADEKRGTPDFDPHALNHVRVFAKVAVWAAGLLLLLHNLGYNITGLLAGLGVAGIAVGLAVQNILGDLFSYFCIILDRPFRVGDYIVIGTDAGTVEAIGIRSTRLRTLQGQELVVSNAEITAARINNFQRMTERRILFRVDVVYGTDPETVARIPGIMRSVLETVPGLRVERVHFASLAASSLQFEAVYFVAGRDYADCMDVQERINNGLYREFLQRGIEFAFPTQTVHLARDSKNTAS